MKTVVIGIVGSRRRDSEMDYLKLLKAFWNVVNDRVLVGKLGQVEIRLVSGGCPKGGDRFAEKIAKDNGFTITIHYPDWDQYQRAAGFVRNTKIAEDCDILIAVVADDRTGGTEDTIKKAKKFKKKVYIVK